MNRAQDETAEAIVGGFLESFREKPADMPVEEWLDGEFAKHPGLWRDEAERKAYAAEVAGGIRDFRAASAQLEKTEAEGGTREDFLRGAIEAGCKSGGVAQVGRYAAGIDRAVGEANALMAKQVFTKGGAGGVNQAPTLDGNIAEAHHAGTFNIDAAVKEADVHAEVPASHGKDSVDILVKDGNGKIVGKYQSKYGADAKSTEAQFGNRYRGQRKLAPEGQAEDIPGATDRIEAGGAESKPLSKEEAVAMKKKAQETGQAHEYDWNDANAKVICRHIGRKAAVSGLLAIGFQGARILGRRAWNALSGKKNKPVGEDLEEFAESAAKSGAAAAGMAAVSGGLAVAAKKGLLGGALKAAKGNVIANAACAAVENVKILAKLGSGEINGTEALDLAGKTNCALVGSLAGAAKGASAGAAIGAALGPVGAAVGGFIGGVVGGSAGSTVGHAIYEGAKAVCRGIASCARAVFGTIAKIFNPCAWFA